MMPFDQKNLGYGSRVQLRLRPRVRVLLRGIPLLRIACPMDLQYTSLPHFSGI